MGPAFFPNPYFGWAFVSVLTAMLGLACITDWRAIQIPKWISLTTLALGLLFHLARGAWLGAEDTSVWLFGPQGSVLGAIDALLFALTGGMVAFALMLGLFIAGGCGGGDVKLFAAVGAWVGAGAALWVFVGAAVVLMALSVVRLSVSVTAMTSSGKLVKVGQGQPRQHSRWMTYSFPLMVGTLAVLWWYLHQELSRVS